MPRVALIAVLALLFAGKSGAEVSFLDDDLLTKGTDGREWAVAEAVTLTAVGLHVIENSLNATVRVTVTKNGNPTSLRTDIVPGFSGVVSIAGVVELAAGDLVGYSRRSLGPLNQVQGNAPFRMTVHTRSASVVAPASVPAVSWPGLVLLASGLGLLAVTRLRNL